jgi:hypothetical protein
MIIDAMPKIALTSAPAPIVKKWCSHTVGQDADRHRRHDHRAVAEQWLAGEGRNHLGEHTERRQDQDIDLRMTPGPDQVHEHHNVAAGIVGEEVEAEVTVQQQHRQCRRQDREGGDDQKVGGKRCPAEHRHAQIGHAGGVHLQYRGDEVDPCQQCPHPGDLQ